MLSFDDDNSLQSFSFSLSREWLETNGIGGYGLLVAATFRANGPGK